MRSPPTFSDVTRTCSGNLLNTAEKKAEIPFEPIFPLSIGTSTSAYRGSTNCRPQAIWTTRAADGTIRWTTNDALRRMQWDFLSGNRTRVDASVILARILSGPPRAHGRSYPYHNRLCVRATGRNARRPFARAPARKLPAACFFLFLTSPSSRAT